MEIDAWTPGTSNIALKVEGVLGFLGRILCVMKKEEREVADFPAWIPGAFSVWNVGQNPAGALERHNSSHSGWRGSTPSETNSSNKCQMRNIRSAVGWQRTVVTREGFLEEVGLS